MEELEYITQKAMMQCSEGTVPGLFTPTYNQTTKINSCIVSTNKDKIPMTNIPSFVVCKKTQKACVPVSTEWKDTYAVKVKGAQTLIGKSCMDCGLGGKIEFLASGQVPLTADEEAQLNGMRENAQKNFEEEEKEKNKSWWQKAGEFVVDCIPVVGPVVSLVKNVSQGNWAMAALDVGFLALDVAGLAAAPFTGGASVAGATIAKAGIRQAVKAGAKQVAKKMSKEAIEAGVKQTIKQLEKLSVRSLTKGKLCVFACFPAGTPVATKSGFKNIEDIRTGDEVWSFDEKTGSTGFKKVLNTLERRTSLLVNLKIAGEKIVTTPEHPFYVNGEWKAAGLLETTDEVQLIGGFSAKVQEVSYSGAHAPVNMEPAMMEEDFFFPQESVDEDSIKVYNFEVEDWSTYFVGSDKILVHNAGICLKDVLKEIKAGKKKLREILVGRTPGKGSKTGREVIDRMKKEGNFKIVRGKKKFRSKHDGNWYDLKYADMAHKRDAVKYWNRTGRKHGARSPEVRKWMRDPKNYYLEHRSFNRSDGAKLGITYKLPIK